MSCRVTPERIHQLRHLIGTESPVRQALLTHGACSADRALFFLVDPKQAGRLAEADLPRRRPSSAIASTDLETLTISRL